MYINLITLSNQSNPAPGFLELTAEQEAMYLAYNGFVKIISTDPVEIEPDTEAWEAWKAANSPNITDIQNTKNTELSNVCNQLIYDGMDITLSDSSTKHFTYTLQDQANISEMFTAVMAGATQYPYHADDEGCEIYSAQDIITIYSTLSGMKTAQITYQNQLKQYVKSLESIEDIQAVTYGQELTGQYLETYNTLVNEAKAQLQTILSKVTTVLSE